MSPDKPKKPTSEIAWHRPILIALGAGGVAALIGALVFWRLAFDLGGVAFFSTYLLLTWGHLERVTPEFMRDHAEEADEPSFIILAIALAALATAFITLFLAINGPSTTDAVAVGLGFFSVLLGWFTVQVMMAMHYAYRFYRPLDAKGREMGSERHRVSEGLAFPKTGKPGGWDFLYHSLTVAITSQVADVDVTSTAMRKMVIAHAVASFVFNTMVLAAAVNVVVSLGQ